MNSVNKLFIFSTLLIPILLISVNYSAIHNFYTYSMPLNNLKVIRDEYGLKSFQVIQSKEGLWAFNRNQSWIITRWVISNLVCCTQKWFFWFDWLYWELWCIWKLQTSDSWAADNHHNYRRRKNTLGHAQKLVYA